MGTDLDCDSPVTRHLSDGSESFWSQEVFLCGGGDGSCGNRGMVRSCGNSPGLRNCKAWIECDTPESPDLGGVRRGYGSVGTDLDRDSPRRRRIEECDSFFGVTRGPATSKLIRNSIWHVTECRICKPKSTSGDSMPTTLENPKPVPTVPTSWRHRLT